MRYKIGRVTVPVGLAICTFGSLANMSAEGASQRADRQAITLAYHNENVATDHKDAAGSMVDYSPQWYARLPSGGLVTYQMIKQSMEQTLPYQQSATHDDEILSLVIKGDNAQARVHEDDTQLLANPQSGQVITLETKGENIDYWQRRNGRWLHSWSKVISVQVARNGQVVLKQP